MADVPREFSALRALIGERAATLPRRLTQVATYALDSPDEIAFSTAASIAADAGVQPSTLVRLPFGSSAAIRFPASSS